MTEEKEVYPVKSQKLVRFELLLPEPQLRRLEDLRRSQHRPVSDLIREGIEIILGAYWRPE